MMYTSRREASAYMPAEALYAYTKTWHLPTLVEDEERKKATENIHLHLCRGLSAPPGLFSWALFEGI